MVRKGGVVMRERYEVEILGDIEVPEAFYIISRYKAAGFYEYLKLVKTLEEKHITIKEVIYPKSCIRRFTISRQRIKEK